MNTPANEFKLFPTDAHFWSLNDYRAVVHVTKRLNPKRVVEFGPGNSTLALIEGGAGHITSCEDNRDWLTVYDLRIAQRFKGKVDLWFYLWCDPLTIPNLDDERFDMALIDGPFGTERRPPVIEWCIQRCDAVLVCCEDLKGPGLRKAIVAAAERRSRKIEFMETGPLAGSFALIT